MRIGHVIFDLHGTLEDLVESYAEIYKSILCDNGATENQRGEIERYFYSNGGVYLGEQLGHFLPHYSTKQLDLLCDEFFKLARRLPARPFKDAVSAVRKLRSQGRRLYITTNIPEEDAYKRMEGMGLSGCFDMILGSAGTAKKRGYGSSERSHIDLIMERSGEQPEEFCKKAVYVGDGNRDMVIAKSYGIRGIGIARSYASGKPLGDVKSGLLESGAKYVIGDIGGCIRLIKEMEASKRHG